MHIGRFTFKLSYTLRLCLLTMAALGLFHAQTVPQSFAETPVPRVKPVAPNSSQLLSQDDAKNFRLGMRAAQNNGWSEVGRYKSRINDPVAKDILAWRMAVRTDRLSLNQMRDLISRRPDWPYMITIRAKAEKMMFDRPLSSSDTLDWFNTLPLPYDEPASGEGRAVLARAYFQRGDDINGKAWLQKAWGDARLTRDRQKRIFSQYKNKLTPEDHAIRADHLIWLGSRYYSSAQALLPHMSAADRKLMDARMRVGANRSGMDNALKALTPAQSKDTGLLFERARWRRKRKSKDYALPVYLDIVQPASTEKGRDRLWTEQKIMAYWLISDREYRKAYDVIRPHGMTRGSDFAEAEFLAGWLSLQKLNNAQQAKIHFDTLRGGVSTPVSVSRAAYWQGRAESALGLPTARARYAEAARHPNTYYGQLAIEETSGGLAYITLPPEDSGAAMRGEFEAKPIVRALRMIGETGDERIFRQFSFHYDDQITTSAELTLLSNLAKDYVFYAPAVRAAKLGGNVGPVLTESSYPIPAVITDLGPGFDIPYVFAIARQESEFAVGAISHANAYGMMQMINATAKETARRHRIRYSKSRLTSDQEYAAKLGALHINDLLDRFDGNYIMVAAAYNAGPHRVKRWVEDYGDPRDPNVDPIDWVESLPFSETRNYIMRVMENHQVYKARLNNDQAELTLRSDLARRY